MKTMLGIRIDRSKRLAEDPGTGHNRWHPDIPPVIRCDLGDEARVRVPARGHLHRQLTGRRHVRGVIPCVPTSSPAASLLRPAAHPWKVRVSRDLGSLRLCPRLPVEYFRSGIASGGEVHHDNERNLTAK
jgi:hypothetical protein